MKKNIKKSLYKKGVLLDPVNFTMVYEDKIGEALDQHDLHTIEQSAKEKIANLLNLGNWYEEKEFGDAMKKASPEIQKKVLDIKNQMKKKISSLKNKLMPSSLDGKSSIKLFHFSRNPKLTIVDPKFQGTAEAGEERSSSEYGKPDFSNFYVEGRNSWIESIFDGNYVYETTIKSSDLYDSRNGKIPNKEVAKKGFKGIYLNVNPGEEQVRMFVPLRVKKIGQINFPKGKGWGSLHGSNIYNYIKK